MTEHSSSLEQHIYISHSKLLRPDHSQSADWSTECPVHKPGQAASQVKFFAGFLLLSSLMQVPSHTRRSPSESLPTHH